MLYVILVLVVGYLFGCIQTGYVVGKINKIDIRDYGSGNSGTTIVLRTLGFPWAAITFLGDALKGLIWLLIVRYFIAPMAPDMNSQVLCLLAGLGAVLGHNYPFELQFKGGKGIATSVAIMIGYDWRMGLIGILVFLIVCALTRYVSLSSLCFAASLPVTFLIFHFGHWGQFVLILIYTFSAFYRHKSNIERLRAGTESKIGQKAEKTPVKK